MSMSDNMDTALKWWGEMSIEDCFVFLKKYGYQDAKKPWKYRPLSNKGIYLMWCRENNKNLIQSHKGE